MIAAMGHHTFVVLSFVAVFLIGMFVGHEL